MVEQSFVDTFVYVMAGSLRITLRNYMIRMICFLISRYENTVESTRKRRGYVL